MKRIVALFGLMMLATSACATTVDGRAAPDPAAASTPSSPPTTTTTTARATAPGPGQRPVTLPLAGVDVCKLYPDNLQYQPGYRWPPTTDDKGCVLSSPEGLYRIAADPHPIAYFIRNPEVKATRFSIGGYPAIIGYNLPDNGEACFVNIDVEDASNLEVSLLDPTKPGTGGLCPKAKQMANVAMGLLPTLVK